MTLGYTVIPITEPEPPATAPPAIVPLHSGTCRKCKFWCDVDEVHMAYLTDMEAVICIRCWRRIASGEEPHMPDHVRRDATAAAGTGA